MGINVQLVRSGAVVVKCLAMQEMSIRMTGANLDSTLQKTFTEFGIDVSRIYSLTVDNGSNMIKATELMRERQTHDGDGGISDSEGDGDTGDDQLDGNEGNGEEELMSALFEWNRTVTNTMCVGIRCAAHTAQLVVSDAMKDLNVTTIVDAVRHCVRKLRTPIIMLALKQRKLPMPILDCAVRWSSTFDMIRRLRELKNFISELLPSCPELNLSLETWQTVDHLIEVLLPAKILIKTLQYESLTLSDFYAGWVKCTLETMKLADKNPFADTLVRAMRNREDKIMHSNILVAALFLDPRYQLLLSRPDRCRAMRHLSFVHDYIAKLEPAPITPSLLPSLEPTQPQTRQSDPLKELLQLRQTALDKGTEFDVDDFILTFNNTPRETFKDGYSIFDFWEHNKMNHPQLYELAKIVYATPATQVSVERSFSVLSNIFSKNRCSISEDMLHSQMIIALNS